MSIVKKGMGIMNKNNRIMINLTWMGLVNEFIKDTNYELKPIDRPFDVTDMLKIDEKTGKIINYGSINNVVNTKEFREWVKNNEH